MAKKKQAEEAVVELAESLADFSPAIEEAISTPQRAYNTNDLRVLQGLPQIEHLEPATVVVE